MQTLVTIAAKCLLIEYKILNRMLCKPYFIRKELDRQKVWMVFIEGSSIMQITLY